MEIELENVAAITKGHIKLEEGKINILYGANGIGKTTFIKALQAKLNNTFDANQDSFRPLFAPSATPKILVSNSNIKDVFVFNRQYVDDYLYKEDIANNSYSLIAKTADFENRIQTINGLLDKLKQTTAAPLISSLKRELDEAKNKISYNEPKKGNGLITMSAKSKIGKTLKDGVKKEIELRNELSKYASFKGILNWIDWVKQGVDIVEQTDKTTCPFCSQILANNELETIKSIASLGSTKAFKDNEEARKVLLGIGKYGNPKIQNEILNFCNSKAPVSQVDASGLRSSIDVLRNEIDKITNFSYLTPISATDIGKDELKRRFSENKVDLSVFDGSSSDLLEEIKSYNKALTDLELKANELIAELSELNSRKKELVNEFKNSINNFLDLSGIPYEVSVDILDKLAFTHLRYKNTEENIGDVKNTLSYGEFNAVALCLFALEAIKKENSLIVLDDPISSYDSEKRAAILISLFCEKKTGLCLRGRTIAILTHDFETLVPFFKWPRLKANQFVSGWHLSAKSRELIEEPVNAASIRNTAVLEKEYSMDANLPLIIRIVHLRRYYQLIDLDGDEYQYLSCLTHDDCNHDCPSYKKDDKYIPMDENKVHEIESKLQTILGKGNFSSWKEQLGDTKTMIRMYRNENNDYNKLIIARQLIQNQSKSEASWTLVKIYITETYHVDTEHIFGFKNQFDNVPHYILGICDDIVDDIESSQLSN